jgi:4-hydroxy-tetrahydrodipicolinate reductase
MSETLSVCIVGATGWTGPALVRGVLEAPDLTLRCAVSRSAAGQDLGEALGGDALGVPVFASVAEALDGVDVLVDYTSATAVKANVMAAIAGRVHVVIGSSGLTADDFEEIEAAAREGSVGVVASGNFSLTAAMCQAAALLAARHLPSWEVIDYASAAKPDVPSGTARELAERLGEIRRPELGHPDRRARRAPGGARRHRRRHPDPLRAPPELRRVDRGGVRPARRAPDHPPRRRRDARALRGGDPDRGAQGPGPRRAHARARHAAARVGLTRPRGAAARAARAPVRACVVQAG